MTVLLFILFNLIFFFFFRGCIVFYKLIRKKNFEIDKISIFNIPLYIFYPISALFVIGNLSVLINFFFPLNSVRIFFIIFLFLTLIINFYEKIKFESYLFLFFSQFIVPGLLSISSYGLKLHFDAIDYHLNFQNWVRESEIVIGLTNLYMGYGWSSIYDYILSNFWIENNFIVLHFVNLLFFVLFYNFLSYNFLFSENFWLRVTALNITIFGFLDNFGINGGANGFLNIQMIGKPDLSVGVLIFICFILFIKDYLNKHYSVNNLMFFASLSLFAFQIKIVSSVLAILLIYYIFKLNSEFSLSYIFGKLKYLLALFFIYLTKNILISGCLIFPISITCIDGLFWTDKNLVKNLSESVSVANNFALRTIENINVWFDAWINHSFNLQVYSNFLISIILIFIFNRLVFHKANFPFEEHKKIYGLYLYTVFLILVFMVTGPTVRYGYGIFLILVSLIGISKSNFKFNIPIQSQKIIFVGLIFITIGLSPRGYSYQQFFENPFIFYRSINSTEEYLNHPALIEEVELELDNSECYIVKTCIKTEKFSNIQTENFYRYKIYFVNE